MALLGYYGGSAFKEDLWRPIAAAIVVAALVALIAERLRRSKLS
jgi:hypothetical protein